MIRAILFDLDGVLVPAADSHFEALNLALQEVCGRPVLPNERDAYEGLSTRQKLAQMVQSGRIPSGSEDAIYRLKQAHTMRFAEGRIEPDPVKQVMCGRLRIQGYKLACVSNCIRDSVEALLRLSGLRRSMEITVSNEDVARPKPSADPYLLACQWLSVIPEEAMVVEDHERGVAAASAAGCYFVQLEYSEVYYLRVKKALDELKEKETRRPTR